MTITEPWTVRTGWSAPWKRASRASGKLPGSACAFAISLETQPDYRDLCAALNDAEVEYLIVDAHALAAHGHVRATKDLDVWVRPTPENAERLMSALTAFGAPTQRGTAADFAKPDIVYQIGLAPIRIDIITVVDGLTFDKAWPNRVVSKYDDQPIPVIALHDLLLNKRASGRPQDLADIAALEKIVVDSASR